MIVGLKLIVFIIMTISADLIGFNRQLGVVNQSRGGRLASYTTNQDELIKFLSRTKNYTALNKLLRKIRRRRSL